MADFSSFTSGEMSVLCEMFERTEDLLRHEPDAILSEDQKEDFYSMQHEFYEAAKAIGCWWAQ